MQTHTIARELATSRCRYCAARNGGFCSILEPESVRQFSALSKRALYAQDTEIITQGDCCDRVGVIASGLVKLQTITESGEEHLLQVLRTGQLLSVPGARPSRFTWQTATDVEVCWLPERAWERFLLERPQHFHSYMNMTIYQLEQMQIFMSSMRGRNTLQRVAYWLIEELLNGSETQAALHIDLSRRDLASLLDMTVETLCRSLRALQDKGAIRLPKPDSVEIADFSALRHLAACTEGGFSDLRASPPKGNAPRRIAKGWRSANADHEAPHPCVRPSLRKP